jgi:hypothetical protein
MVGEHGGRLQNFLMITMAIAMLMTKLVAMAMTIVTTLRTEICTRVN